LNIPEALKVWEGGGGEGPEKKKEGGMWPVVGGGCPREGKKEREKRRGEKDSLLKGDCYDVSSFNLVCCKKHKTQPCKGKGKGKRKPSLSQKKEGKKGRRDLGKSHNKIRPLMLVFWQ